MNSISTFPRQVVMARNGNRGQALTLFLVTALLLLSLVFSAVYLSHLGVVKVASANRVDAVAISAATWEARALNLIAALNDGVYQCIRLIRWICAIWAVLAVAASTGYGAALFSAYSDYAQDIIRNLWSRAEELADWSKKVKDMAPGLVLAETADLSRKLHVTGMLSPSVPGGSHDAETTLELHLKEGEEIGLSEALAPILDLLGSGIGKAVKSILNPILAGLLGASQEPIHLLEPEDDFASRQFVRYTGYLDEDAVQVPLISPLGRRRFTFSTCAQPYGGSSTKMTWKSRLFEKEVTR